MTLPIKTIVCFLAVLGSIEGWSPLSPLRKANVMSRKSFLVGTATGAVLVGAATAAGAAVVINNKVNNNNGSGPYEPAPGSMTNKVVVITGGTTGLGLESAKRLAAAGATVVLTSRTNAKGENAISSVNEYLASKGVDNPKVYNLVLDLDDLENVKAFPSSFKNLGLGKIDVLMNNAGVMAIPDRQLTKDGYERTFQSNHLGHFVLTAGLFPYISRESAVVINVSSDAYNIASGGLELDNLNGEKQYGPWTSYGLSKLANILFTEELQRRADESGDAWLTAVALHPGMVQTDLARYVTGEEKWNNLKTNGATGLELRVLNFLALFSKSVQEGASTQVFLAAGADGTIKKGAYYADKIPKTKLPDFATDKQKAKALWERSEELGGIKFNLSTSSEYSSLESPSNT